MQKPKALAPDYFYRHPNLRLLQDLLAEGSARFCTTGLIFNLLNHRPEICTVLVIDNEDWWARQRFEYDQGGLVRLQLNREFLPGDERRTTEHGEFVTTLPLDDDRWRNVARPWTMVPPGAPALILGAKMAVQELDLPEPAWLGPFTVEPAIDPSH